MDYWKNIYSNFDPVAIELFGLKVHWYGIMYVLALLSALWMAYYLIKKDSLDIPSELVDKYFIYVEIGVIVGARVGFFIFYSDNLSWYLTNPWQMFNPFDQNGEFVGIRGMSFHGAVIGFGISSYLFARKYRGYTVKILDVAAIAIPFGYIFGRIGNFLNKELIGRVSDVEWAINVNGILRHPSQLYEALLEGVLIFTILYLYRKKKRFDGELIFIYLLLYAVARSISEIFREPDIGIGFICCDTITMGQILSFGMVVLAIAWFIYIKKSYNIKKDN